MNPQDAPEPKPEAPRSDATQQVHEAHSLLQTLRDRVGTHPELEEAIEKLEMALSVLTTKTGGLL